MVTNTVIFAVRQSRNTSELLLSNVESHALPESLYSLFSNGNGPITQITIECEDIVVRKLSISTNGNSNNDLEVGASATYYLQDKGADAQASYNHNSNNNVVAGVEFEDIVVRLRPYRYQTCEHKGVSHCVAKELTEPCADQILNIVKQLNGIVR